MNPFPIPGQYATPPTCFPALPPNPPPSSSFWYSINVRHRLKELQETLTIAKAFYRQMELEMQVKDNEDAKSGPDDPSLHQILKFVQDRGVDIGLEESYSVQAANALISKLGTQLEPFRIVTDNRSPWEEKSAALRLSNKINKSKRNKLWRKKKRNRVREMLEQHQQFDEADKAADEWRIREIAKDIARRKVENMKEIAKIKEKEVKRRLESELELVLIVEKLQELRSIRIQKLKKQGHFIPEEDDEYLERVRAAVEEEELLEIAATYADAAKDGIANVEGSWNPSQGSKPEVGDLNNAELGKMEVIDQSSDLEAVKATGRDAAVQTLNLVSDGNAHDGASDSVANLPLEFYHYYHGSNHDIGTLIEVRKSWDDYIRPGGRQGLKLFYIHIYVVSDLTPIMDIRIPGQWVQPPSPANEVWASYLVKPK
ncbi:hypothetical protein SAY87_030245 [Trapa incisa]|uniref:Uncharacterized protein n=1 Tax=Trapa incisa TaxID=236973 RepID=A0AAN7QLE9_9MYRT|nr:hypothetical protein SAY87_030245 [Trapa incisa]